MENHKILLKRVAIKNWMGINAIVPIHKNVTWLNGKNGCGKSSFIDAFSTVLYGTTDKDYNKASDSKNSSRTTTSAVHNQLKTGEFTRNGPVIAFIIFELYNESNGISSVQGMQIKSMSPTASNPQRKYFYGKEITFEDLHIQEIINTNDIEKCNLLGKNRHPNIIELSNPKESIFQNFFNQRKMNIGSYEKYKKQMNRVLTAKLTTASGKPISPDEFVKSYILPETSEMAGAKETIENIKIEQANLNDYEETLNRLQAKTKDANAMCEELNRKLTYEDEKRKIIASETIFKFDKTKKDLDINNEELKSCENNLQLLYKNDEDLRDEKNKYKNDLDKIKFGSVNERINNLKERQRELRNQFNSLERDKKNIEKNILEINDLCQKLDLNNISTLNSEIISNKKEEIDILKRQFENNKISILEKKGIIKQKIEEINQEINGLKQGISDKGKQGNYDFKNKLNQEFKKLKIDDHAYFLYEAIEYIDPNWQKAIESSIGNNLYLIHVKPENIKLAVNLSKNENGSIAKLKDRECDDGCIAEKIKVKDGYDLAQKTINFLFGNIRPCETIEELKTCRGLMRDGRSSDSWRYISKDIKNIKLICGQDALKKTIKEKETQKEENEKILREIDEELSKINHKCNITNKFELKISKCETLNFDVDKDIEKVQKEQIEVEESLTNLLNSDENKKYLQLLKQKEELEKQVDLLEEKINKNIREIGKCENKEETIKNNIKQYKEVLEKTEKELLDKYTVEYINEVRTYIKDNDFKTSKDILDKKDRIENNIRRYEKSLDERERYFRTYDPNFVLLRTKEGLENLKREKKKYEIDDISEIQETITESRKKLENSIDGFFELLKSNFDNAKREIDKNNRILKNVRFESDTIEIKIDKSKDQKFRKYYEYIRMYCDETSSNDQKKEAELELKTLFDKILKSDGEEYIDYRNYISATIKLKDKDGKSRSLEQDMKTSSGGQEQTPYYILLAMSLITSYKDDGLRVIVLDEAFSKMDINRVKAVLCFFKELGLQVILSSFREDLFECSDITHVFSRDDVSGAMKIVSTQYNKETDEVEEYVQ